MSIFDFYTLDGAEALATALAGFDHGRLVVHITEMPIKCPVAPLEVTFLAEAWLRKRGLRDRVELVFVTPLDGAFTKPVASERLGAMLDERKIHVEPDFMVERIDQERQVLVSYDEREVPFDLLDHRPAQHGRRLRRALRAGRRAELRARSTSTRCCRRRTTRSSSLGDASDIPTSKAGSVAHFAVDVFVDNFLEHVDGQADDRLVRRARQLLRRVRRRQGAADRLQLRHRAAARASTRSPTSAR